MKKVYALSYHRFVETLQARSIDDTNVTEQNTAFIQIGDIDREAKEDYDFYLKDTENVISLRFDDCDETIRIPILGTDEFEVREPMTTEQAQILYNFIETNKDKETFLVHCRAGQSRSGGVVSFLGEYFGIPEREVRWMSPRIHPNRRIVNILNNIHHGKDSNSD